MNKTIFPFIVLFSFLLTACTQSSGTTVEKNLSYGDHELQTMDLCIPEDQEDKSPAIILIHGGGWRTGDKGGLSDECKKFAEDGMLALSMNYRLSPDDNWPTQQEDVNTVIDWVKENADTYNIDPQKIAVFGKSAGGHLAALAGTANDAVSCTVIMYGPTDMTGLYEYADSIKNPKSELGTKVLSVLFGGTPEDNPSVYSKSSPVTHISSSSAQFHITHGSNDKLAPIDQSIEFADKLNGAGVNVVLKEIEGMGHGTKGLSTKEKNDLFAEQLAFINECFGIQKEPPNKEVTESKPVTVIENAFERITKKPFGIKISPASSPVFPEKFSGYHTGVDFEILPGEDETDMEVYALCEGPLVLKRFVTGYGGTAVQNCNLEGQEVTVLYGHLKLDSISASLDQTLKKGDLLGILGKGYSSETDGERKHLHLSVHKGPEVVLLGYVQNQSQLTNWIDPETLL